MNFHSLAVFELDEFRKHAVKKMALTTLFLAWVLPCNQISDIQTEQCKITSLIM